jgi:hypothetical protein
MMATGTVAMATSLDGFHATASAQRSDELVRAFFAAVNDDNEERIDAIAARSFLSYDIHGTRSRTGFKRYVSGLHESFSGSKTGSSPSTGSRSTGSGATSPSDFSLTTSGMPEKNPIHQGE